MLYHPAYFKVTRLLGCSEEYVHFTAQRRLRSLLGMCARFVPFYRRAVRLSLREIANEPVGELLARFPYVSKAEVMESRLEFLDERLNPRWLMYVTSHGSTGSGIGVWRSKRLADIEKAFYVHEWGRFGFSFHRSRYLHIRGDISAPTPNIPLWVNGNRLMLSPRYISHRHKTEILSAINRFRPTFVHAYPSSAVALSEIISYGELDTEVDAVLLSSEPATPQQLANLELVFRCPISISYGLTERTNLAFASHEKNKTSPYQFINSYAVNENRLNGGHFEIVGTSLWNDVMPLIRYCTGDFGIIEASGMCATIDGRDQEFVTDISGNRVPGLTIAIAADAWDWVRTCQIRQSKVGAIAVYVVPRHGHLTSRQTSVLRNALQKRWGGMFEICVVEVPEIEPGPGGKRRFVINDVR
jgi:phenylacetate-CoA ligase